MAIINIDRLEQLKNEKNIALRIELEKHNDWRTNLLNHIENNVICSVQDVFDTFRYFLNNKMNTKIFDVDETPVTFGKIGHDWYIIHRLPNNTHVRLSIKTPIRVKWERHISGMIDDILFPSDLNSLRRRKDVASQIEDSISKFEIYCKIVTERLNNL